MQVVPSLPALSYTEISDLAEALAGVAPELQIDIVDGQFVEAVSWPFTEADPEAELSRLKELTDDFLLEIDCMVTKPEQYLELLSALPVARVIVHFGSTDQYEQILKHARAHNYLVGLAFTNDIDLAAVVKLRQYYDYIQVMGIAVVGKQGQPFDERTLSTVRQLKEQDPDVEIAVDGAVNKETILDLKAAGVTRFAPGSAIAKQADPQAAYEELLAMVL